MALFAAITWGAGDFNGGVAAKSTSAKSVVVAAHSVSLAILIIMAFYFKETSMTIDGWLWGATAGLGGGFGLMFLYSALSAGNMALAAPISAIIAASIPVLISAFTIGVLEYKVLIGFILASIAIWALSSGSNKTVTQNDIKLPVLAGISFGIFFICLHRASNNSIILPLIAVRIVSISSLVIYSAISRQKLVLPKVSLIPIILSGIFDTMGNGAFALASQYGRVDVASILGSLYPGSTVFLSWIFLKEQINGKQLFGVVVALMSILLISI
jgi:drug/metabolite transporter (DMT)-like permease